MPSTPARINWNADGERLYEAGVDRAVLFPGSNLSSVTGVAWNGILGVADKTVNAAVTPYYMDGEKYYEDVDEGEFSGTIDAYTYPDEFEELLGTPYDQNGMGFGLQPAGTFQLVYRTSIGNDLKGMQFGYKLHFLYNVRAMAADRAYKSQDASPDPMTLSFNLTGTGLNIPGRKRTPHLIIDSRKTNPALLSLIEGLTYGSKGVYPRMLSYSQMQEIFTKWGSKGLTERVNLLGLVDTDTKSYTNLATNPSFETSTGLVTAATNLAYNPGFEGAGSAVVIKTNLAVNPVAKGSLGLSPNSSSVHAVTKPVSITGNPQGIPTAARSTIVSGATSTYIASYYNIDGLANTGPARKIGAWVYATSGTTMRYRIGDTSAAWFTLANSQWVWVTGTVAANTYAILYIEIVGRNATTADVSFVTGVTTYPDEVPKEALWGDRTNTGDFVYAWTGTADSSTTEQRGTAVSYPTPASVGAGIQSTEWTADGSGKSLRLIPTYSVGRGSGYTELLSQNQFRYFTRGSTYTASVVVRRAELNPSIQPAIVLTGTTTGQNVSKSASGQVGVETLTLTFTIPATGDFYLRLYNNGMLGDPDVWFDNLIIVEGTYIPDFFSGSTSNDDFVYSWTGDANATSSTKQYRALPGMAPRPTLAIAMQSTDWSDSGTTSLRIQPLGASNNRDSFADLDTSLLKSGKTYTILAKFRMKAPQKAPGTFARRIYINDVGVKGSPQLANEAGVQELRWVVTMEADARIFRLYNGGGPGDSDVWWDSLAVIEGEYDGPYFDGSQDAIIHSQRIRPVWNGTAHASSSTATFNNGLPSGNENDAVFMITTTGQYGLGLWVVRSGVWTDYGLGFTL